MIALFFWGGVLDSRDCGLLRCVLAVMRNTKAAPVRKHSPQTCTQVVGWKWWNLYVSE